MDKFSADDPYVCLPGMKICFSIIEKAAVYEDRSIVDVNPV
jgi:hypothetical protein